MIYRVATTLANGSHTPIEYADTVIFTQTDKELTSGEAHDMDKVMYITESNVAYVIVEKLIHNEK